MSKKIIFLLLLAALLFFGCTKKPPINGSGDHEFSLQHDEMERKYFVHIPPSYNKNTPTPVILNFHGGSGSPEGHQDVTKMNATSDKEGFIVVYPRGTRRDGDPNKRYLRFWNIEVGPNGSFHNPEHLTAQIDDVGFVNKLLDELESKFNVDEKRVYATGFSNGAILSYFLACKLGDRIAAIAPVGAPFWTYPEKCNPSRPISVMHFHGTEDKCAPFYGGLSQCTTEEADVVRNFISSEDSIEIWLKKNNCPNESKITFQNGEVSCETYGPCNENTEVTLCTIENSGHTWPGGKPFSIPGYEMGETTKDIIANDAMWEFFKKHPRE